MAETRITGKRSFSSQSEQLHENVRCFGEQSSQILVTNIILRVIHAVPEESFVIEAVCRQVRVILCTA